jgi:type IV secretory pathway TrbD component
MYGVRRRWPVAIPGTCGSGVGLLEWARRGVPSVSGLICDIVGFDGRDVQAAAFGAGVWHLWMGLMFCGASLGGAVGF